MIQDLLTRNDIGIMCITETWVQDKISDFSVAIAGYQMGPNMGKRGSELK